MNILGVGAPELIIIFLLALVIAGPKRMVAWAYIAGRELARLRAMWSETMAMVQQELKEAGLEEVQELSKIKDFRKFNVTDEVRKFIDAPEPSTPQAGDKPAPPRTEKADGSPARTPKKPAPAPKPPATAAPHPEARAVGTPGAVAAERASRAAEDAAPQAPDDTQAAAGQ